MKVVKKILIIVLVLIFAGAVLSRNAFAAETVKAQPIDYQLTYPGTLPDSPLYVIKNIRDQIVGLLIRGPVNKSFYLLMLSDKRLWAGELLINGGNDSLGATTLVKAEEYFSSAVSDAMQAKKEGRDVSALAAKLLVASSKHEEILTNSSKKVTGEDLAKVVSALTASQNSRNRVLELTSKN